MFNYHPKFFFYLKPFQYPFDFCVKCTLICVLEIPSRPSLSTVEIFQCLLAINIIINNQCYKKYMHVCYTVSYVYTFQMTNVSLFSISNRTYFDNIVAIDSLLEHIMVSRFSLSQLGHMLGHEAKHAVLLSLICVTINAKEICAMKDLLSFVCHVL